MVNRDCQNCVFFHQTYKAGDGKLNGECRRHPPVVLTHPHEPNEFTVFPRVMTGQWCAEFLPTQEHQDEVDEQADEAPSGPDIEQRIAWLEGQVRGIFWSSGGAEDFTDFTQRMYETQTG